MSSIQDMISEDRVAPWPLLRDRYDMALPQSRIVDNDLHLWYGPDAMDESHAVLRLEPIPLDLVSARTTVDG